MKKSKAITPPTEASGTTGSVNHPTLENEILGCGAKEVLALLKSGRPGIAADPLGYLLWEIAWFACGAGYGKQGHLERVERVLWFLARVAADPEVEQAWEDRPAGVARLLTLTVAHFPVHVGEGGILDDYDWSFFRADVGNDDHVDRLPRPPGSQEEVHLGISAQRRPKRRRKS